MEPLLTDGQFVEDDVVYHGLTVENDGTGLKYSTRFIAPSG